MSLEKEPERVYDETLQEGFGKAILSYKIPTVIHDRAEVKQ